MRKFLFLVLLFCACSANLIFGQSSTGVSGKFDFIPGEKIIFFDDFSADPLGEFPAKWNTNISGDVVSYSGSQAKWLRMKAQGGNYIPELDVKFPENVTIEFDVVITDNAEFNVTYYSEKQFDVGVYGVPGEAGSEVNISYDQHSFHNYSTDEGDQGKEFDNSSDMLPLQLNEITHVSVWIQKSRYRMYIGTEKVFDLPKGVFSMYVYNRLRFETSNSSSDVLISHIKIAVGSPDTRNQLLTSGRFSTSGILFDVNSDRIKNESYACIKDIATVLKENPDVSFQIIGYTDSDGDEAKNLDLSKRRAASVKNYLSTEFGVDVSHMNTDGKGETQPVANNSTTEGKAQNRRVEFIRQ